MFNWADQFGEDDRELDAEEIEEFEELTEPSFRLLFAFFVCLFIVDLDLRFWLNISKLAELNEDDEQVDEEDDVEVFCDAWFLGLVVGIVEVVNGLVLVEHVWLNLSICPFRLL